MENNTREIWLCKQDANWKDESGDYIEEKKEKRKKDNHRKNLIYNELQRILRYDSLSKGSYEVANKICNAIDASSWYMR